MKYLHALAAVSAAATIGGLGIAAAPVAQAYPWYYGSCGYGSSGIQTPWGGYCDGPAVNAAGDHWHCENAPFYSGCMWKNTANITIAPPGGFY